MTSEGARNAAELRGRRAALRAPGLLLMGPALLLGGLLVVFLASYGAPRPDRAAPSWPVPVGFGIALVGLGLFGWAVWSAVVGVRRSRGGPRVVAWAVLVLAVLGVAVVVLSVASARAQVGGR